MSAVRGTFADFKTVKTRGQCQAIIEFPIEDADHVLAVLGGIPQPSKEQWVGVAPISGVAESEDDAPDKPVKLKGGPLAGQAGMLCRTTAFLSFLVNNYPEPGPPNVPPGLTMEGDCASYIRDICNIRSRAELDHDINAAITWKELTDAYYDSQRGQSLEQLEEAANR